MFIKRLTSYKIMMAGNPNEAKYYYSRGTLRSTLKDYQNAIADFTKTIELNLDDGKSY